MSVGHALSRFRPREFNRNVRLFFAFGTSINAGMALFSLLYNLYLLRLSYQEDFIGQVASMAPLATGLLALPTGILSDRLGRKPFLIASGLLLAISQLGLCLTTSPGALLTFSFVGGVAMAFVWVNHVPFLSDNAHPARRAEALAIWSALQIIVRMLLSLIGGFMPGVMSYFLGLSTEVPEPFRYALFFGAACSLIAVVPLFYASGPSRREKAPAPTQRPKKPSENPPWVALSHIRDRIPSFPRKRESSGRGWNTRDGTQRFQTASKTSAKLAEARKSPDAGEPIAPPWRVFAAITALSGTRGFSMGLTYPFFNVFFEAELGVGPAAIGAIFFLSQLAGLPATFAAPTLVRRFGPTLTILPARTMGGSALGIMGAFISLPLAVPMFLLVRIGEVIDNPSDQHFSTQVLPRHYWARIQGLRVCGFQLLNFLGSLIGGILILDYGYGAVFGLACASRIASGLIMAAFFGLRPARPLADER